MGFLGDLLERWRRRRHRGTMNWRDVASTLLTSHELERASGPRRGRSPGETRDAVLREIGGMDAFVEVLVEVHYEEGWSARADDVLAEALERSGYAEARERLLSASEEPPGGESGPGSRTETAPSAGAGTTGRPSTGPPAAGADDPTGEPPTVIARARAEDPEATQVAQRALAAWHEDLSEEIAHALSTGGESLSPEQAFTDAYSTVRAVAAVIDGGRVAGDLTAVYDDVHRIGRERASLGTSPSWVAISWYVRQHAALEALRHYVDDGTRLADALDRWRQAREHAPDNGSPA